MALIPTLWRTCRVLANPLRLRCLQAVLKRPGLSVSELARATRLSVPLASQYLRDLQARGIVSVARRSRWTCYGASPDPSVAHAAGLLAALRAALAEKGFSPQQTRRLLQGFTHQRRIAVLRLLVRSAPRSFVDMRRATGISASALARHLDKLEACGLVRRQDQVWLMTADLPPLAQCLLREACS